MTYKFINTEYISSVAGGDKSVVAELVSMFGEQVAEFHNQMNDLLAAGKYELLGMLAHKAKSSVAIMGINDLAVMLKTFELQAKEGKEKEKYASYIERFRVETNEALKELNDYVANQP